MRTSLLVAGVAVLASFAPHATQAQAKDIVETAVGAGTFKTLAMALTEAGLIEILKGPGPFTVFAPTDEAFAKLPPAALAALLKDKSAQIVDARSEKEHCGDVKMAKQAGHIPGAIHLEWTDALDKSSQKFKSADQLKSILKEAGIDLTKPVVAHCQSGGRAAVMAFTLELMGANAVSNYYRGWSEWGNSDDTPIVVSPKKK